MISGLARHLRGKKFLFCCFGGLRVGFRVKIGCRKWLCCRVLRCCGVILLCCCCCGGEFFACKWLCCRGLRRISRHAGSLARLYILSVADGIPAIARPWCGRVCCCLAGLERERVRFAWCPPGPESSRNGYAVYYNCAERASFGQKYTRFAGLIECPNRA